jgi:hypothetical protein
MNRTGALLLLVALGAAVALLVGLMALGKVPWFGRLPGDIYIGGKRGTFYFPLATCVLISAVLSLAVWLIRQIRP